MDYAPPRSDAERIVGVVVVALCCRLRGTVLRNTSKGVVLCVGCTPSALCGSAHSKRIVIIAVVACTTTITPCKRVGKGVFLCWCFRSR